MSRQKKRERNICTIENCRSYREANLWPEPLTFHEFPADLNRRKQWLQIIGREDWIPGDKAKLCGAHFSPECYRISETASAQKRLILTAVPSLNLVLEPLPKQRAANGLRESTAVASLNKISSPLKTGIEPSVHAVCSVPNCWQYREAQHWPEPITFHEIPSDPLIEKHWGKALETINCNPSQRIKVCSAHFKPDDFCDTSKRLLKTTAVPTVNLQLKKLFTEVEPNHKEQLRTQRAADPLAIDPRKRFSNIIVVDLIKDNKRLKVPERQKPQHTGNADEGCSACLEMKKDLREMEFQLACVRKELEEQKKLVEKLKMQIKDN